MTAKCPKETLKKLGWVAIFGQKPTSILGKVPHNGRAFYTNIL